MPLDAHEEDQFRRIAARLRDEDPTFGSLDASRPRLRAFDHPVLAVLGQVGGAAVLLVLGLALLPAALATGFYPLGLLGYAAATFASVRLLEARRALVAARGDGPERAVTDRATARLRGVAVAAVIGIVGLAVLAPGGTGSTTDDTRAPVAEQQQADATTTRADAPTTAPVLGRRGASGMTATTTATP